MNKNGFEAGSHQIFLYHNLEGDVEKISSFKGSTFNLENGVVTETKLDDKSVLMRNTAKITISGSSLCRHLKKGRFLISFILLNLRLNPS
jgi:hypothetical protein